MTNSKIRILVCGGMGCKSSESRELADRLKVELEKKGRAQDVEVLLTGCFGFCSEGPIIKIHPDNVFYVQVRPEDAKEIVAEHIVEGRRVERLLYVDPDTKEIWADHSKIEFYQKQYRIALRNCGLIDPENIEDYIGFYGYEALGQALSEKSPEEVIQEVKDSGLRGRGGGGFPTGLKWELTRRSPGSKKYVICNADEGDPGAFMDRSILEGDPHSVLEAMAIAGYATGADEGIIYIRAEYPLAIERLRIAIEQAEEYGLLGEDIFSSGFNFKISLKLGAGAFVCGEETALIHSMEGSRGEPTKKPPYPAESGYLGRPTTVNNVETLSKVSPILLHGAKWHSSIGTKTSKGTKVFALAGDVNNVGLVEVPMGTTLREIIFDIGGGIADGRKFKAVQTGGPSGGVITEEHLDTPIDYESLKGIGSMMGSGGMIVMDEKTDMVEIAKFYLEFTQDESCGKCTPCRIGTKRLYEILERLTALEGDMQDLDKLQELGKMIKDTALCGLGQTAPNPILSTMRYFPEEYERYARRAVKKAYSIDADKCIGCGACKKVCPIECITGEKKKVHDIDEETCIACGACYDKCKFDAIIKP